MSLLKPTRVSVIVLFVVAIHLPVRRAFAGACCGGGLANVALMTGDEKSRTLMSLNNRQALWDISNRGEATLRQDSGIEESQNQLTLEHSQLIRDDFQWGVRIDGSQQNLQLSQEKSLPRYGLGDLRLSLGYEFLSELEYSWWKPKGFLILGAAIPLGKSTHETWDPAEATSEGHFTPTFGLVFFKANEFFDISWATEIQTPLEQTFRNTTDREWPVTTQVSGGTITQTTFALGHTFQKIPVRLAGRISPLWRSARKIQQEGIDSETDIKRLTSLSIDLNWFFNDHQQLNFTFTDQTSLRNTLWASNTALSQFWSLAYVHRVNR